MKKAVAFIKYTSAIYTIELEATHQTPEVLTFIFGGKEFDYVGFNGQMANIVFGFGESKFIDNEQDFLNIISSNRLPKPIFREISSIDVIT
jgi:hypothetical protein